MLASATPARPCHDDVSLSSGALDYLSRVTSNRNGSPPVHKSDGRAAPPRRRRISHWKDLHLRTFVFSRQRTVYVSVPKAACTSMKRWLLPLAQDGETREPSGYRGIHNRTSYPAPSLAELSSSSRARVVNSGEFLVFTVVRNPYDRLFSAFVEKILIGGGHRGIEFERWLGRPIVDRLSHESFYSLFSAFVDFVVSGYRGGSALNPHWQPQTELLRIVGDGTPAVVKTEDLGTLGPRLSSWHPHFAHLGQIPRSNETQLRPDWAQVDDSTLRNIRTVYSEDFAAFDFSTEPITNHPIDRAGLEEWIRWLPEIRQGNERIMSLAESWGYRLEAKARTGSRLVSTPLRRRRFLADSQILGSKSERTG